MKVLKKLKEGNIFYLSLSFRKTFSNPKNFVQCVYIFFLNIVCKRHVGYNYIDSKEIFKIKILD